MTKRQKKKYNTFWLRCEIYKIVNNKYSDNYKVVKVDCFIRRYKYFWDITEKDVKYVRNYIRRQGIKVKIEKFVSRTPLGVDGWLFIFD